MSALSAKDLKKYHGRPSLRLVDPESLAALEQSRKIEVLSLNHFHRIRSLEPLSSLTNLRALFLTTTNGWDGTNRHLLVETFEPLVALRRLEIVQILGVVPERDRLQPLSRMPSLEKLSIGNTSFYQLEDFAGLSVALPRARGSLQPIYQMNFISRCRRCKKHALLFLAGAKQRSPRYVCPACGKKKIISHLQRWNSAGGVPQYDAPEKLGVADLMDTFGNPNAT
ncbi:MAG: hypothetical protein KIS67_11710 [Verrucomicrobiae bacterium]|nr:hypothetical protein [Verrucomicrobiae bacterium]